MTKDAEATCAHLLANAKVVEGQLKALRTEHEILRAEATALRRCLDKSGVLPSAELEAELQRNGLVESMGVPPSKTPETPVAPPTPGSGATTPTHSTRSLTRQGRSPRPRDFGVRGRSPPPAESPQDLPAPNIKPYVPCNPCCATTQVPSMSMWIPRAPAHLLSVQQFVATSWMQ